MKPGDLVKYDHPANPTLGIVKSTRSHNDPPWVLVQWCNERQTEEWVYKSGLKNLTNTQSVVI